MNGVNSASQRIARKYKKTVQTTQGILHDIN